MFEVRIEDKPAFAVIGRKAWISTHTPDGFGNLFREAHASGLIERLMAYNDGMVGTETNAAFLGVAVTANGQMDYYIAAEVTMDAEPGELERIIVPASRWAVLESKGVSLEELSALENYGYGDWLLKSGYQLTDAPQMNAFLSDGEREYTELWLPITEKTGGSHMKIRPYLTFNGTCNQAIELYKKAFKSDTMQVMHFSDMPPNPAFPIPNEFKDRILQATMQFGEDYIRMSDCGPGQPLNDPESERISLAMEMSVDEVKYAFAVLAEEGRVGIELAETFYSPCAGVVFDKFGVMWNFVGQAGQ